jgi:hypothetical protein
MLRRWMRVSSLLILLLMNRTLRSFLGHLCTLRSLSWFLQILISVIPSIDHELSIHLVFQKRPSARRTLRIPLTIPETRPEREKSPLPSQSNGTYISSSSQPRHSNDRRFSLCIRTALSFASPLDCTNRTAKKSASPPQYASLLQ